MPKQNKQTNKKEINEDGAAAAAVKSTNDDFFFIENWQRRISLIALEPAGRF